MLRPPNSPLATIVVLAAMTMTLWTCLADQVSAEPTAPQRVSDQSGHSGHIIRGDLNSVDWKSMVDQEVTVMGNLVVVDTFNLVRHGQIKVARDRLYVPTSRIDPNDADPHATSFQGGSNVAQVTAAQKFNQRAMITIDDGSERQNIFPPTLFPNLGKTYPTVRVGSTLNGVTGKLIKAGRRILLVPTQPLEWTPAPRPPRPDLGQPDVTVASFNVLNYFTTLDDGRNYARGADSQSELLRQEAKLVAAIVALQADVIGLMEIENNLQAEHRIVAAVNEKIGKSVFTSCGVPGHLRDAPGGNDSIRVAIIYRSDRVVPVGNVALIDDLAFGNARTPIVQTFSPKPTGRPLTVIVNHFKSKGGSSKNDNANKKKGDGQGAHNARRRSQSLALCNHIDAMQAIDPTARILVMGDLNAYAQEDPIDLLRAKGLIDLHQQAPRGRCVKKEATHYSYIYRGQSGCLDHALATESLATDVTGIATWHINADEPRFLDYNQEYNPRALYQANPFRSSDHDPVLIGIRK